MNSRRDINLALAAFGIGGLLPLRAMAVENTKRKFVFILQRGAADGLSTLVPYADPDYQRLRTSTEITDYIKIDGLFGLHRELSEFANLFQNKEASFIHAIASPYRERSHFDGQNILEGGFSAAYESDSGWLNRLAGLISPKNPPIAFTPTLPLVLRGNSPSVNYSTSRFPEASSDLLMRVSSLYETDKKLYDLWLKAEAQNDASGTKSANIAEIAKMVSGFMTGEKGANLVFLESQGWDTHENQNGRIANNFKTLNGFISALKSNLGTEWAQTTILIATEFGRTAAQNGTGGTDHGTASCAFVLGGALNGGKIIADWPGLSQSQLFEGRDLRPTNNLFGLISGVVGQTFGLDSEKVARNLFPKADYGKILSI